MKTRIILLFTLILIVKVILIAQAPDWQWATQVGGIWIDYGRAITIDDAGNSYVTGSFQDIATFGSYSLISSGSLDIFVAKMDANGNWLWATKAGGIWHDSGGGITIDDAGNTYVTGYFEGTAIFGSYSLISSGENDIFVAKMDAIGNWQWASKAGGIDGDCGYGITIDDTGNSYVTGYFRETATFGSYSLTSHFNRDIFVAKMDANGNWLWATRAGGGYNDFGYGITIDGSWNSYVTGEFENTATFGSFSLTSSGEHDIFVAKMDAIGNWLWATQAGGADDDEGNGITIDTVGNIYLTGFFWDTATFGSYTLTSSVLEDIFVAKMDADGNWLWATRAGGYGYDVGYAITIDEAGNSYVTGRFGGTAFFGSYSLISSSGSSDIFVAKMDANGNWLWATQAGGSGYEDRGYGITIDDAENCYVTGRFDGTATFGSYSITSSGFADIFVAKLNSSVLAENYIIPTKIGLSNFPNPFNPSTTISFTTELTEGTELSIYNIKGQKVKTINSFPNPDLSGGTREVVWNGNDDKGKPVSSGIYFYKLKTDNFEKTRKMILMK